MTQTVYAAPATLAVHGAAGLDVSPVRGEVVDVRCLRAGTFELSIDVAAGGKHLADTIAIGCIAPARFTATNVHETAHGAPVSLVRAHAVDAQGRAFAGLHECAATTSRSTATACSVRVVDADRVCFDVLGEHACRDVR